MITHGFWTLNKNIVSVVQTLVTFSGLSVYVHFHGTLKWRFLWPLITSKVSEYGDLSSKNLQLIDGICDLSWHQKYQNEKKNLKNQLQMLYVPKFEKMNYFDFAHLYSFWKYELFWFCFDWLLAWLITCLIDYLLDRLLAW